MAQAGIANLEQCRTSPAWETVIALATALGAGRDAFLQEPDAGVEPIGPGRPKKVEEAPPAKPASKKKGKRK